MEIIIGRTLDTRLRDHGRKIKYNRKTGELKARVIGIRSSRRRTVVLNRGLNDRRGKRLFQDPTNSKVITLLIENADMIPDDIGENNYNVTLKFSKI
ncbi:MAG: hypothetical protein CSA18_00560 [Deltaproteobacteria bacterium]|nr:MAG: hypothetical protein CSB21_00405 [Deltaproteobacteria bacterium]PIE75261.1 MAG: hypothetical protein CSA18_00560 [Deltaproteobacteria bacterium]